LVTRLLAVLAIAPFASGLTAFWIAIVDSSASVGVFVTPNDPNPRDAAITLGGAVTLVAFVTTIAVAFPAVMAMIGRPLSLSRVLFCGALIGQLPVAAGVAGTIFVEAVRGTLSWDVPRLWYGWFGTGRLVVLGLFCGLASAAAFWLVGVRGTPLESGRGINAV
jgi:hypothetical protein